MLLQLASRSSCLHFNQPSVLQHSLTHQTAVTMLSSPELTGDSANCLDTLLAKHSGGGFVSEGGVSEHAAQCVQLVLQKCDGHPGSAELWEMLRENSEAKIAQMDAQMSKANKSAFNIYTRDLRIKQDAHPHPNCLSDDWEEDFQKLHQAQFQKCVQHLRNRLGLMSRASELNQEKATALIANNPIPDLNNLDGKDSPMRFLSRPSAKIKYPVRKQIILPPLQQLQQPSADNSRSLRQEERGTLREKAVVTKPSKKESASNLLRKDFKKVVKPSYILSSKVPPMKPKKSKECNLEDTVVISISEGLDACRRS
ncbi:uncharacterized protein LOC122561833 isoform X2 [Chiloscyllium plagiosum]|uniref:uncharacterized protein LOC122561833 isoform X2 n=1 Tax=Chiloscyllium plagiosum TaxID=36176 RepID=UPI001CB7B519|nr:uncharacterized protein LOC122561833 isoform X2 [Chiloscyllium plagiosum]